MLAIQFKNVLSCFVFIYYINIYIWDPGHMSRSGLTRVVWVTSRRCCQHGKYSATLIIHHTSKKYIALTCLDTSWWVCIRLYRAVINQGYFITLRYLWLLRAVVAQWLIVRTSDCTCDGCWFNLHSGEFHFIYLLKIYHTYYIKWNYFNRINRVYLRLYILRTLCNSPWLQVDCLCVIIMKIKEFKISY